MSAWLYDCVNDIYSMQWGGFTGYVQEQSDRTWAMAVFLGEDLIARDEYESMTRAMAESGDAMWEYQKESEQLFASL